MKADKAAHPDDKAVLNLKMKIEYALHVFMRYRAREKHWVRRQVGDVGWRHRTGGPNAVGEGGFTMQDVGDVCAYVMECMPLVPERLIASLESLRAVLRTAQDTFGNIDKRITVRIVEWVGDVRTVRGGAAYTINEDYTTQQAVRQEYPAFPGDACRQVVLRRGVLRTRLNLWDRTPYGREVWSRDQYEMISDGDVIEIEVCVRRPLGPEPVGAGRPTLVDWDDEDYDSGLPPGGAKGRRLCDLLRELGTV